MEFVEKVKDFVDLGSLIIMPSGEPRLIIEDTNYGETNYALITLDGHITTSWCNSIDNLLIGMKYEKTIPNSKLVLTEI